LEAVKHNPAHKNRLHLRMSGQSARPIVL
jgi:hypothetical protein